MTYDQWKTRDPNDRGFYDMLEDDGPSELELAYADIERLQGAKRRALAIADERSKENVALRNAQEKILAIIDGQLKFYQEEHTRKNLTELGQHSFNVLRGIRERISIVVSAPQEIKND